DRMLAKLKGYDLKDSDPKRATSPHAVKGAKPLPGAKTPPPAKGLAGVNDMKGVNVVMTSSIPTTYIRALRAGALATFNRPQDRDALKEDVDWLVGAQIDGGYTYDSMQPLRAISAL